MGLVVGVLGASGGVGASTLTAALAERAHTVWQGCSDTVAVDLDIRGGLDTVLCREHLGGARWPDLVEDRDAEVAALADLPGDERVHVLAGTGEALGDLSLVAETLAALVTEADLVAVDVGPRPPPCVLSRLDLLVVMARLTAKGAADASALVRVSPLARTERVLVTRGPKGARGGTALGRELGMTFLGHLADDPHVARQAAEGLPPGVLRSSVDALADEVLAMLDRAWLVAVVRR